MVKPSLVLVVISWLVVELVLFDIAKPTLIEQIYVVAVIPN